MSELMADIIGGTPDESENIQIFDLVCQRDGYLYKADQSDEIKPCDGIVYTELNGKYYHIRHGVLEGITIEGTYTTGVVYFGTNGQCTFDEPSTGYIQVIGLAFLENVEDSTWSVMFNICESPAFIETQPVETLSVYKDSIIPEASDSDSITEETEFIETITLTESDFLTQPDVPRSIRVTGPADKSISVSVSGVDIDDNSVTYSGQAGMATVFETGALKTIISVICTGSEGITYTVKVGTGKYLGIPLDNLFMAGSLDDQPMLGIIDFDDVDQASNMIYPQSDLYDGTTPVAYAYLNREDLL